jgi:hypothetical protein
VEEIGTVVSLQVRVNKGVLRLADYALIAFHTALVLFNCTGWIWRATRRWHLATMAATAGSWFLLGLWFGQGYCICTDLHWRVRHALGERVTEDTYIQYLVAKLTGWTPSAALAANVAGIVFLVALLLSVWLNLRDMRERRALKAETA